MLPALLLYLKIALNIFDICGFLCILGFFPYICGKYRWNFGEENYLILGKIHFPATFGSIR